MADRDTWTALAERCEAAQAGLAKACLTIAGFAGLLLATGVGSLHLMLGQLRHLGFWLAFATLVSAALAPVWLILLALSGRLP